MAATAWPRRLRLLCQTVLVAAFALLLWGLARPQTAGALASLLLAIDPLTTTAVALADWTIPRWTWLGLLVLAATAVLGRFFCGWICPLGSLQQLVSSLGGPMRRVRAERNRYRPWFATKYLVLLALLVSAAYGANSTGWLAPLPLLHRASAVCLQVAAHGHAMPAGWISVLVLLVILLLSAWMPRLFCRAVCPLGALLGLVARLAPLRIRRDGATCSDCRSCLAACQGADEPFAEHRISECHLCLSCLDTCSEGSLRFGLDRIEAGSTEAPTPALGVGRRRFLLTTASAAVLAPVLRGAGGGLEARAHDALRPPGALGEEAFLARCIGCGACVAACPTGALLPDLTRTGVEGLFTPVLVPRRGWCEPSCTRCGEVCPTGALAVLDAADKQAIGGPARVSIGTAFLERGRCLPWAMERACIVCEEMCPTSPKAIRLSRTVVNGRDRALELQLPYVDPELCTGCGLCENRCPVGEAAAIRVSRAGESRDPGSSLLHKPAQ